MRVSPHLADVTQHLTAVAQGRMPADTVIKNATLVNVNTAELMENTDIAIAQGRIALVGDASHTIGSNTIVFDAQGQYVAPGFMDGHMHVESSMLSVKEYARAVIPAGTTAIFADPHEIANVLGVKGIDFMVEDSKNTPLRFYVAMPSCVPAVEGFEDNGAAISTEDIETYMEMEQVCGLGEVMNFPAVLAGEKIMHKKLAAALNKNKIVTGHYPISETGSGLNAYIAAGVRCCHETTSKEEALAKMRLGMYVQIREGSAWQDLTEVIRSITETKIDTRYASLCSDDTHPHTLMTDGHLDYIVRKAIALGVPPITAIQMVTINVAQCFQMDRDLGSVSPGRVADLLILSDLTLVKVEKVFIDGILVAEKGKMTIEIKDVGFPDNIKNTMHLKQPLLPTDFKIDVTIPSNSKVLVNVIEIIEAKAGTYHRKAELSIENGEIVLDGDIVKAAVVERHKYSGNIGKGFVKGFGLKYGAAASTVAHDAHNLIIIGTNDEDMALAGNVLAEVGGGMVTVKDGKVLQLLPLPLAGLMSDEKAQVVADKVELLDKSWKELGCTLVSPFMTMALLSLCVIPELRLTNKGLVDCVNFRHIDLYCTTLYESHLK